MVSVDLPRLDFVRERRPSHPGHGHQLINRADLESCLKRQKSEPFVLIDRSVYLNSHVRKLTSKKSGSKKRNPAP